MIIPTQIVLYKKKIILYEAKTQEMKMYLFEVLKGCFLSICK